MVRKPEERAYHNPSRELGIITGRGNNSKDGEAVIKVGRMTFRNPIDWLVIVETNMRNCSASLLSSLDPQGPRATDDGMCLVELSSSFCHMLVSHLGDVSEAEVCLTLRAV